MNVFVGTVRTLQAKSAAIAEARVSAIIRTADAELARQAMQAAVDGGFRMIEFTLTTPDAFDLIGEFSKDERLLVGAGTVMSAKLVEQSVAAGASFIVSPITDGAVIDAAHQLGAPCIPGAYTPTEMQRAYELGADVIKVFPAPPGGAGFIEAVLAPLPHLKLFPTAGATPDNFTEFLDAGCVGVGFVRTLFVPAELAAGDFAAIRRRAEFICERLLAWREKRERPQTSFRRGASSNFSSI